MTHDMVTVAEIVRRTRLDLDPVDIGLRCSDRSTKPGCARLHRQSERAVAGYAQRMQLIGADGQPHDLRPATALVNDTLLRCRDEVQCALRTTSRLGVQRVGGRIHGALHRQQVQAPVRQASIMRPAMLMDGGTVGSSSGANQPASAISSAWSTKSPDT